MATELAHAELELEEVKEALREGKSYLGLTGSLLKEYAVEAAKKENLLRKSLGVKRESSMSSESEELKELHSTQFTRPRSNSVNSATQTDVTVGAKATDSNLETAVPTMPELPREATPAMHIGAPAMPVTSRPSRPRSFSKLSSGTAQGVVDTGDLAMVLELMRSKPSDERLQRACLLAIGRLSKDASALRPLCLGVISAVAQSAAQARENLILQRLAVTALSSVVYLHDVAALVAPLALPVVIEAALAFPEDVKLQTSACEAFARLAQGGSNRVVSSMVKYLAVPGVVFQVLCDALQRLCENSICQPQHVLDELIKLSDSDPSNLELQRRVSLSLKRLSFSIISVAAIRQRTSLTAQWAHLLERFLRAEEDEAKLDGDFHNKVQHLFHEEVALHFEFEAAERCLHYLKTATVTRPGGRIFREVLRSLAENLEDYRSRSEARELAWDVERQCLAPLDPLLRLRLHNEVLTKMEQRLPAALRTAADAVLHWPSEEELQARTEQLMKECRQLLETKTEVTQTHFERAAELRREVMLFEAVEYLELHSSEVSPTQVLSALQMLKMVEKIAPADALERLRCRLGRLTTKFNLTNSNPTAKKSNNIIRLLP